MTKNKNNYKDSGVNIEEGQKFIDDIKNLSSKINPKYSLGQIGGFSGYVENPKNILFRKLFFAYLFFIFWYL